MTIEHSEIHTNLEMQHKMELQTHIMEYALKTRGIDMVDWAVNYSDHFRQLFENSDLEERYMRAKDKNPEDIYEWVQHSVEEMAKDKK